MAGRRSTVSRLFELSHEALDLFIDAFASITGKLNTMIEALKDESEEKTGKGKKTTKKTREDVIMVEADEPLRPGESTTIKVSIYEDSTEDISKVVLRKSDFIGQKNQKINLRAIRIHPKTLLLKAREEKEITITIKLPKSCQPGRYNALLTDTYNPLIRIIVSLEVIA